MTTDITTKIQHLEKESGEKKDLASWVKESPKQRCVVLKTIAIDPAKRTSEQIREKAKKLNPCLSRISTKVILKDLIKNGLVETERSGRLRYYWISENGKYVVNEVEYLK